MITKKEKLKIMSIINMCNAVKNAVKTDNRFWILKIKEICEELLK